jgi:hypothetical protein
VVGSLYIKIKIMAKGQKHHVIALALNGLHHLHDGGINTPNLVTISVADHELIHRELDIPYQKIREFRMRQGYKQWHDLDYHVALQNLQWEYFKKLRNLPRDIQQLHAVSMKEQVKLLAPIYKYPYEIKDYEMEPYHVMFEYYFNQYHNIFKHYAQKLSNRLQQK